MEARKLLQCLVEGKEVDRVQFPSRLSVVSYNVLNEASSVPKYHPKCAPQHLHAASRAVKVVDEIASLSPDVVCLQEVDHYKDRYYPLMSKHGYDGVFKKRTADKQDGCAIFFKKDLYYLEQHKEVEYKVLAEQDAALYTDYIAQIAVLKPLHMDATVSPWPIHVMNTHLYWKPEGDNVRLAQMQHLIQSLEDTVEGAKENPMVILCGDFNSTPKSSVHHYLSHSKYGLASSYDSSPNAESVYTRLYPLCAQIDYVWYSKQHLCPLQLMDMPDKKVALKKYRALPCKQYPSDHFSLYVEMALL